MSIQIGLILSNDWEVFGDGSGDYFQIQHRPLEEMLIMAESKGLKFTIMAEVGQQLAHKKIADKEPWAAKIVDAWEDILKRTLEQGSDVQLHIHPQWENAVWTDNGWKIDASEWAIGELEPEKSKKRLKEGRDYLESLLRSVNPNYRCKFFRAGSYCIQPSERIIPLLKELGFICDSSVTKDMKMDRYFDYSSAESNIFPWMCDPKFVTKKAENSDGILELPIYSQSGFDSPVLRKKLAPGLFYKAKYGFKIPKYDAEWQIRRSNYILSQYPITKRPIRSLKWFTNLMINKSTLQLDIDQLPSSIFVKFVEDAYRESEKRLGPGSNAVVPLMASGHVKGMPDTDNLKRIVEKLNTKLGDKISYITLSEAVKHILTSPELLMNNNQNLFSESLKTSTLTS